MQKKQNDDISSGYNPIHPVVYNNGMSFPELSHKTFKNNPVSFVYDMRSFEGSLTPVAKLVKKAYYTKVYMKDKHVFSGQVKQCLAYIHQMLNIGVLKNGKVR